MKAVHKFTWKLAALALALVSGALVASATAPVVVNLGTYSQCLQAPARVAADAAGKFYVTDPAAGRVTVFDAFGRPLDVRDGFAGPLAIAVAADGKIYLSEEQTRSVSVFNAQWERRYQLGSGAEEFQLPANLAVDPRSPGTVYVSDGAANLVRVYTNGTLAAQFGGAGSGDGQFDFAAGIAVRTNGEVFVIDQNNDRVEVFTNGFFSRQFKLGASGMLGGPTGRSHALLVDDAGRVFVTETSQGIVNVFDADSGAALGSLGSFGEGPGQLQMPVGLALDGFGRLGVASANNGRVELFGVDDFTHFSAQPAGGIATTGDSVTFSVTFGGTNSRAIQWRRDGADVGGATNGTFTFTASLGAAGDYSVLLDGTNGTATALAVVSPPQIISEPDDQTALRGTNVLFAGGVAGSALELQWEFNGMPLDGATNMSVLLQDVQATQAGEYKLRVANRLGSVASRAANLTVISPPVVMDIVDATQPTNAPFALTLNVDPGFSYALEGTADFRTWSPVAEFTNVAGLFDFTDLDSTNFAARFYRLRWVR